MCLGAAGGQATWHPDVEQKVLLEAQLLFPTNCTPLVKQAFLLVLLISLMIVVNTAEIVPLLVYCSRGQLISHSRSHISR